ncbi:MAG: hypothetical protein IPI02_03495 [Sterolibacteriaceae bacterium]|nr:hypothetical protein [Sterolibacteriaceae bacterium]
MSQTIEVKVPDIGDFNDVPVIDVLVKPGDVVKAEDALVTLESDKATMDVPSPATGTVKDVKIKVGDKVSQGTLVVLLDADASSGKGKEVRSEGASPAPAATDTPLTPLPSPLTAAPSAPDRLRMRNASSRRGPRRLFGGVPQRRPRHEDGAGRALRHARRHLPQCRLHPVEGAAARHRPDRRGLALRRARRRIRQAESRHRQAACAQDQGGRQAHHGTCRHGQGAQGRNRARLRPLPRCQPCRSRTHDRRGPGQDRREEGGEVRQVHHRRRQHAGAPALHPGRSAHRRFHRRARTAPDARPHAGDRRRHHRPRDGDGLFDARRAHRSGRNARRADAGPGPRLGHGVGEAERPPLRQDHAGDQDRGGRSQTGRPVGQLRRQECAGRAAALRHDFAVCRPHAQRQENRRREGRRRRDRARLHPGGRQADAHQRAAHPRDRRHHRQSDAGAQGRA